jgi:glycosyltransferase involved in cell wall biosynthesis
VGIVIATYNRAHVVMRAIDSVLGQTYPNVRAIVVDDGSTDGTIEALNACDCNRPLKVIRLGTNRGAPVARNDGIAAASGEYVAFLDSDDVWHPQKLRRQIERLRQLGPDFGACYTRVVNTKA